MPLVRRRALAVTIALTLAALLSATVYSPDRTGDLSFFVDAYRAMVGDEGLRVYVERPNIQSGPVALLSIGLLTDIGDWAFPLAVGLLFVVVIWSIGRTTQAAERGAVLLGVGGAIALFWWRTFAFQGHLDDAAVLAIAVVAVMAVRNDRHLAAAVSLGLALAIKPWAVFLLPIVMRPDQGWRRRLALPALSLAIGGTTWMPFLLASTDTMTGAKPTVWLAPDSVYRLFIASGAEMPAGLRALQILVCIVAVAWVTLRGHVASAVLLGVALRMMLDGGTWPYYTAGLVVGALLWDVFESEYRMPWATIAVTALFPKTTWIDIAEVRGLMRLIGCLGAIALVLWTVRRDERSVAAPEADDIGDETIQGTVVQGMQRVG